MPEAMRNNTILHKHHASLIITGHKRLMKIYN
jgi:hypothetical protein